MLRKLATTLVLGATIALTGCDDEGVTGSEGFLVQPEDFAAFDQDRDANLDQTEFSLGFNQAGVFRSFDRNRSGFLEANEFSQFDNAFGTFEFLDRDADARLNEGEFLGGVFTAFDSDDNELVNQNEFNTGLDLF